MGGENIHEYAESRACSERAPLLRSGILQYDDTRAGALYFRIIRNRLAGTQPCAFYRVPTLRVVLLLSRQFRPDLLENFVRDRLILTKECAGGIIAAAHFDFAEAVA